MSVREYIGARYLPLFPDPIEWDNSKTYEPLTIVYYQGNSYTSRQAVPTGIAITNDDYWALTGNYNAQIEAYREEVLAYSDRITEVEGDVSDIETSIGSIDTDITAIKANNWVTTNRINDAAVTTDKLANSSVTSGKIADKTIVNSDIANGVFLEGDVILIGDSYGSGWSPDGTYTGWTDLVEDYFSTTNREFYVSNAGGTGFGTSPTNFYTQLQGLVENLTTAQKNNITTIVFGGGFNDVYTSSSAISTGMSNCMTYIKAQLPNAKNISCCCFGNCIPGAINGSHTSVTSVMVRDMYNAWKASASDNLLGHFENGYPVLCSTSCYASDRVHPNQTGQNRIAYFVICAIMNWRYNGQIYVSVSFNPVNGASAITKTAKFVDDFIIINGPVFFNTTFGMSEPISSFTFNGQGGIKLCDITPSVAIPRLYGHISCPVSCIITCKNNNVYTFYEANGILYLNDTGGLELFVSKTNSSNNNFLSVTNITSINVTNTDNIIIYPF